MNLSTMQGTFNKKWIAIAVAAVLLIIVSLVVMMISLRTSPSSTVDTNSVPQITPDQPVQSPEVQRAVAEQMNVDREYADWQNKNRATYPWMKKLPLTSESYYLYFDLNKNVFVARIFPKSGQDPEPIKAEVTSAIKTKLGVSAETYRVEWSIIPQ